MDTPWAESKVSPWHSQKDICLPKWEVGTVSGSAEECFPIGERFESPWFCSEMHHMNVLRLISSLLTLHVKLYLGALRNKSLAFT